MPMAIQNLILSLLIFSLYSVTARSFFILSEEDFKDTSTSSSDDYLAKWDEFDPVSWRSVFEPDSSYANPVSVSELDSMYTSGVAKVVSAASSGYARVMEEAVSEIDAAASEGHACARDRGRCKGFCTGRE
nr:erad-associated e3 ubiquitin-protein ligase component hrd3a [Quercus suber]